MKTNTDPNGNKNNITFRKYEKYGNTYIRARQWATLIDGTVERLEGSGKNRVDARAALEKNIEKRNEKIQYGMKKDNGEITLAEAVKLWIEERSKEYDREKGREARRDVSTQRDWDVYRSLLCPFKIADKKLIWKLTEKNFPMPGMISALQRKSMNRSMHIIVHLL